MLASMKVPSLYGYVNMSHCGTVTLCLIVSSYVCIACISGAIIISDTGSAVGVSKYFLPQVNGRDGTLEQSNETLQRRARTGKKPLGVKFKAGPL